MDMRSPDVLVVTPDLGLSHAVGQAAPGEWCEWQQTLGSAIAAITPQTRLIVLDMSIDGPMATMLANAFVEQRPGRRAILVQAAGDLPLHFEDERVTVLSWPVTLGALTEAAGSTALSAWMSEIESSLADELVTI
jgi:hypothetical protein